MLVLRVRDEPDPSREGAGVLRGLDILPAGVVGSAQELCVSKWTVSSRLACKAEGMRNSASVRRLV